MTTPRFNTDDYVNITIALNSPYKWGKGWTASREEYEQFEEDCLSIIKFLGLTLCKKTIDIEPPSGVNEFGEYMYFHPEVFSGTVRKSEVGKFTNCVGMITSPNISINNVSSREIKTNLLPYQSGYSDNPNVRYEKDYLPVKSL